LKKLFCICLFCFVLPVSAFADEVKISNAWVEESTPGQDTAIIQMVITSKKDAKLIEAASGMAQNAEIHHAELKSAVMTIQKLNDLELPAKTPVTLSADGIHIKLIGLRKPLLVGHKLPFALTVQFANGKTTILRILAIIKPLSKKEV
jgi:copper(I)-binding protein